MENKKYLDLSNEELLQSYSLLDDFNKFLLDEKNKMQAEGENE